MRPRPDRDQVARDVEAESEAVVMLRARARIRVLSEALDEHASYFDAGVAA